MPRLPPSRATPRGGSGPDAFVRLLLALLALVCLALFGCTPRLVGESDVELSYEIAAADATVADVRASVLRRLAAGEVAADVTEDGRRLRLVVDETFAPAVDELVTWSGTLSLVEADPSYAGTPPEQSDLEERDATRDGREGDVSRRAEQERYFVGSRAAVLDAAPRFRVDREHEVVGEPGWVTGEEARAGDARAAIWRSRVVLLRDRLELGDGALVSWADGGSLRVRGVAGSAAARVIAEARERLAAGRRLVVVRGRTSLGPPRFEGDALLLSFGSGIEAYARAQTERQLLTSARLPALRRVGAVGLPPNSALWGACLVVPVVMSFAWLVFVRRFDRAHPEPMWLVLVTFALGAASAPIAGALEGALARSTPWLDPRIVSCGGQAFALPLATIVFTLVVGLPEEGAKLLGASYAARRREFDEPIDGIVYGIVSSLGFAAAENVRYFAMTRLAAPVVVARCFMSVPAHMFFGAIWGYALGARLIDPRPRLLVAVVGAAACHGLFDALLATDGGGLPAVFLNVALAGVFVAVVRRALRHGVIDEATRAVRPESRRLFRVGRPLLFLASSLALHALAFGVVLLGGWYQLSRHRPSGTFVVGSTVMLALIALAAFGVSATLPLDVAVDDHGVTFAGAARAWSRIRRAETHDDHVVVECEGGPLRLGPGRPSTIAALAAAIEQHLGRSPAERTKTLASRSAEDPSS